MVVHGDASAAVGIGVTHDKVEFWEAGNNNKTILNSASIKPGVVQLRIKVKPILLARFFGSSLLPTDLKSVSTLKNNR